MVERTIPITIVLVAAFLAMVSYPLAFAQSESETESEQEIDQKNVCSGWAVCINVVENKIDSTELNAPP
jgi:hypothetical protein